MYIIKEITLKENHANVSYIPFEWCGDVVVCTTKDRAENWLANYLKGQRLTGERWLTLPKLDEDAFKTGEYQQKFSREEVFQIEEIKLHGLVEELVEEEPEGDLPF